jgi:pyruvyltransferase
MQKLFGIFLGFLLSCVPILSDGLEGLPLYYWQQKDLVNFGDYLSVKIVERIINGPVTIYRKTNVPKKKLLALGSLLYFANSGDVLWGTGSNNKYTQASEYSFTDLDVRAIRGPLTKAFLEEKFGIECPEVYGDPALLFPYLFPEFQRKKSPKHRYIVIPHLYEISSFSKDSADYIVYPTDPWNEVIEKILDSEFVISGSLHGVIIAEAYGIPARYVRLSEKEPLFKYLDYYLATGRENCIFARSVEEALEMGGETPASFDAERLYDAFPFEFWPDVEFKKPSFIFPGLDEIVYS